jgi:hypothetical protein
MVLAALYWKELLATHHGPLLPLTTQGGLSTNSVVESDKTFLLPSTLHNGVCKHQYKRRCANLAELRLIPKEMR